MYGSPLSAALSSHLNRFQHFDVIFYEVYQNLGFKTVYPKKTMPLSKTEKKLSTRMCIDRVEEHFSTDHKNIICIFALFFLTISEQEEIILLSFCLTKTLFLILVFIFIPFYIFFLCYVCI